MASSGPEFRAGSSLYPLSTPRAPVPSISRFSWVSILGKVSTHLSPFSVFKGSVRGHSFWLDFLNIYAAIIKFSLHSAPWGVLLLRTGDAQDPPICSWEPNHHFIILDALVEVKTVTGEGEREGSLLGWYKRQRNDVKARLVQVWLNVRVNTTSPHSASLCLVSASFCVHSTYSFINELFHTKAEVAPAAPGHT